MNRPGDCVAPWDATHVSAPLISVALCKPSRQREQLHVGIRYVRSDGELRLLHLRWHCLLHDDPWQEEAAEGRAWWTFATGLSAESQAHLATICETIAEKYDRNVPRPWALPYGVAYPGGRFDADRATLELLGGAGLTCATFVLAVFASNKIVLLDRTTWRERNADGVWHKHVVDTLRTTPGVAPAHLRAVEQERGCARYRPEEVAAGARLYPSSVQFRDAAVLGHCIAMTLAVL